MSSLPLIVDIKRHSVEDGPGIRSVVFLKGCPLRCVFCQNPETWSPQQEVAFFPGDCIQCGQCVRVCPAGAVDLGLPGAIRRESCNACGMCVDACPGNGLRRIGRAYDPDELLEILLRDRNYYSGSGGGVTFSGGECTMHAQFLRSMLMRLKRQNIHIVLQTSGFFNYRSVSRMILPYVDLIHYDIKFANPEKHRRYTGHTNRKIINNLLRLLRDMPETVHTRIPLIPGINATQENLKEIIGLLIESGVGQVSLLPYNPMGISKYESLGLPTPDLSSSFMDPADEAAVFEMFGRIISQLRNKKDPTDQS
ncbi:MAG: glycyl-radical enzyme activating protein [Desulfomonile tiedjei]|uniref:Glycyl-radical enzyme activating protein n=1 Tax=Desulfomonile tiedjei TaxID=2358 RepID=A0A9D6V230_9BACT|nr:glycyl-radical enzyme activating protein [Desulfomonile tiedjei]